MVIASLPKAQKINPGKYTMKALESEDQLHVQVVKNHVLEATKRRHVLHRSRCKKYYGQLVEKGVTYQAGGFDTDI